MGEMFFIFYEVILPVFIIVFIGYVVQIKYQLDLKTMSKLAMFYILPGFIFMTLYSTTIHFDVFLNLIVMLGLFAFISFIVSQVAGRIIGLDKGNQVLFTNSNLFINAGNYGVPVNDLVFRSDPFAMTVQVIVVVFQSIFVFTYGIFSLSSQSAGKLAAVVGFFKTPIFFAVFLGFMFNIFQWTLPGPVEGSLEYIRSAMVAIVLFTLGAQISQIQFKRLRPSAFVASIIRLLIGPIVMFILIWLLGIDGITAQVMMIVSGLPAAANSVLIAQQYSKRPEYAAEIVMISTLLSPITVSLVIYFSGVYFG